jgi:hypothetical protein
METFSWFVFVGRLLFYVFPATRALPLIFHTNLEVHERWKTIYRVEPTERSTHRKKNILRCARAHPYAENTRCLKGSEWE